MPFLRLLSESVAAAAKAADVSSGVPEACIVSSPLPRLYIYDHCPFCSRARMIFGLKKLKHELVFVANDDFETPMRLIGKKMLPILEYRSPHTIAAAIEKYGRISCEEEETGRDGLPGLKKDGVLVMQESMDIVKQIDEDESLGAGPPIMKSYRTGGRQDINDWLAAVNPSYKHLCFPRLALSSCLPEFATKRSRAMFVSRHPLENPSDYSENLSLSSTFIPTMESHLETFAKNILHSAYSVASVTDGGDAESTAARTTTDKEQEGRTPPTSSGLTADDMDIWARMRCVTIVKGLTWPAELEKYLQYYSEHADIPLHTQLAI